ncbi:MAG: three-Cys-motif partner protein TcmP [Nitrospirota bacterium]
MRICGEDCKKDNGNCSHVGSDSLPVQCVGPWVEDKYYFLERYLNATCEARRKFYDKGNAVFIDLFSGPGKCIIKDTKQEINSGGFRAINLRKVPFNEYIYCDIDEENTGAFKKRIPPGNKCFFKTGDANAAVIDVAKELLKTSYRYHFAYIDPFAPENLKFSTLKELAQLNRMDMLIHFPIGAIKRNLDNWMGKSNTILDSFLGTDAWRSKVNEARKKGEQNVYHALAGVFKEQLKSIGYPEIRLQEAEVPVKNTREVNLYVLVLATKNKLAQKIWDSVIRIDPDGQRRLL